MSEPDRARDGEACSPATTTISPPPLAVWTSAVPSPGQRRRNEARDVDDRTIGASTDTCRGFAPTATCASVAPLAASSLSNSTGRLERDEGGGAGRRECKAERLRGARQRDRLHDAQRVGIDDADRGAACLLTTQMRPSGAIASVRGAAPTATSASFACVTASKTLTESLS